MILKLSRIRSVWRKALPTKIVARSTDLQQMASIQDPAAALPAFLRLGKAGEGNTMEP